MKTITCVNIQDYNGFESDWNEDKEFYVAPESLSKEDVLGETLFWLGEQRVVTKENWLHRKYRARVDKALNDAFVAGKSQQSFESFYKEWHSINQ